MPRRRPEPSVTPCRPLPTVEVRDSPVHGKGVFASRALARGSNVGVYEGRRYSERQIASVAWNDRLTYLFSVSDGSTIDGGEGGNATRHLNHACAPNCEAVEEEDADGSTTIRIVTLKRIRAGEELFIDYHLSADATADNADYACRCGAPGCRGTMLASAAG